MMVNLDWFNWKKNQSHQIDIIQKATVKTAVIKEVYVNEMVLTKVSNELKRSKTI